MKKDIKIRIWGRVIMLPYYSKYIFLFHCDELLDAYSFLVDEKNYNSMQEMRIEYNNEKRWNDSVIGWLSLYLTVKS